MIDNFTFFTWVLGMLLILADIGYLAYLMISNGSLTDNKKFIVKLLFVSASILFLTTSLSLFI